MQGTAFSLSLKFYALKLIEQTFICHMYVCICIRIISNSCKRLQVSSRQTCGKKLSIQNLTSNQIYMLYVMHKRFIKVCTMSLKDFFQTLLFLGTGRSGMLFFAGQWDCHVTHAHFPKKTRNKFCKFSDPPGPM